MEKSQLFRITIKCKDAIPEPMTVHRLAEVLCINENILLNKIPREIWVNETQKNADGERVISRTGCKAIASTTGYNGWERVSAALSNIKWEEIDRYIWLRCGDMFYLAISCKNPADRETIERKFSVKGVIVTASPVKNSTFLEQAVQIINEHPDRSYTALPEVRAEITDYIEKKAKETPAEPSIFHIRIDIAKLSDDMTLSEISKIIGVNYGRLYGRYLSNSTFARKYATYHSHPVADTSMYTINRDGARMIMEQTLKMPQILEDVLLAYTTEWLTVRTSTGWQAILLTKESEQEKVKKRFTLPCCKTQIITDNQDLTFEEQAVRLVREYPEDVKASDKDLLLKIKKLAADKPQSPAPVLSVPSEKPKPSAIKPQTPKSQDIPCDPYMLGLCPKCGNADVETKVYAKRKRLIMKVYCPNCDIELRRELSADKNNPCTVDDVRETISALIKAWNE